MQVPIATPPNRDAVGIASSGLDWVELFPLFPMSDHACTASVSAGLSIGDSDCLRSSRSKALVPPCLPRAYAYERIRMHTRGSARPR